MLYISMISLLRHMIDDKVVCLVGIYDNFIILHIFQYEIHDDMNNAITIARYNILQFF